MREQKNSKTTDRLEGPYVSQNHLHHFHSQCRRRKISVDHPSLSSFSFSAFAIVLLWNTQIIIVWLREGIQRYLWFDQAWIQSSNSLLLQLLKFFFLLFLNLGSNVNPLLGQKDNKDNKLDGKSQSSTNEPANNDVYVWMNELANYLLDILLPGDETNCFLLKCSLKNLNATAININLVKFKVIHNLQQRPTCRNSNNF